MLIGAHESTAGGLPEAWPRARADGAEAVQIFTKSNRMWAAREILPEEAGVFRAEGEKAGLLASAAVHASYLINLGSDGELREKSVAALIDELRRCEAIGAPRLVLHPGSNGDAKAGLKNISGSLARSLEGAPGKCKLLLETAAGQGSALGRTFEELREMIDGVPAAHRSRVAVCLDTCHVFAAGYDLSTPGGWEETFRRFDDVLGLSLLSAFHVNDSKKPLGCRVDRHERPGLGCIGPGAFQRLVADDRFENIPGYLELPPEENRASLDRLKQWRKAAPAAGRVGKKRTSGKSRVAPRVRRG